MDKRDLDALGLVCPACHKGGRGEQALAVASVARADADNVVEATLQCAHPSCRRVHPIIDGIPVVVADLPAWVRHQLDAVLRRRDLSPAVQALLADAAGPGTVLDDARRTASTYATAHYGRDLDGGSYAALVRAALELAPPRNAGLALDLGCAVGRGTFELAAAGASLAVGVDLDFHMLGIAERARASGIARYERRSLGTAFDPCADPAPASARTGFLCADVLDLPLRRGAVDHALALNVVDCVASPAQLLGELARVLAPGRDAVVATPYDWSPAATPPDGWLAGEPELRAALDSARLAVVAELPRVPWRLRVHARAVMEYAVHVVHARRG